MPSYSPQRIEPKWQRYWLQHKTFRALDGAERPKYYVLDMFPYPSGDGLHVGHPEGYTASDIVARYRRMRGYNVLHPMGWDAFGLPAEQYAVETGTHPAQTTRRNIANFRRQIQMLGFSYDWDREIDTTDPAYYRWTQWIFLQLFDTWYDPAQQRGRPIAQLPIPDEVRRQGDEAAARYRDEHRLAYLAEVPVNWCPALGTVLANEEVQDGRSERGGHPVVRLPLRQWMLRITSYAERLLADLDPLDWPEPIKEMQRNWIGRSEGAEVDFPLQPAGKDPSGVADWFDRRERTGCPPQPEETTIRVFTTRPDTLFGATYMVLSPEHPLVDRITTPAQRAAVDAYRARVAGKSDLDRTDLAKEKSGVFTGAYAINPVDRQPIPIWIADYVLMGYGTGAIMAVPAHDERDFEFAAQFGLDIIEVVGDPAEMPMVLRVAYEWLGEWERAQLQASGSGRRDSGQRRHLRVAILLECGFDVDNFEEDRLANRADPLWAGVRCHCEEGQPGVAVSFLEDEFEDFLREYIDEEPQTQAFVLSLAELPARKFGLEPDDQRGGAASAHVGWNDDENPARAFTGEGISIESGLITGLATSEAKRTITAWLEEQGLGRRTINYKLRDWLFSRQRYWGEPFPILLDDEGRPRPLGADELPLVLPPLEDFRPTGSPEPPLAKATDWLTVARDGNRFRRETNTMPQWAGSCWYYLRYIDPHNDRMFCDPNKECYWMPVDLYVGGAEHAVLHLLYARFWHKVLFDLGRVHTPEPFQKLVNQGMILGELEYVGYRASEGWVSAAEVVDAPDGGGKVRVGDRQPVTSVRLAPEQVEKAGEGWVLVGDPNVRVEARAFKMSKSRGNVINPDQIVADYGADALRLYEMFMGPLEATKPWSTKGVDGIARFLGRAWRLVVDEAAEAMSLAPAVSDAEPARDDWRLLHQTIRGVTLDIEAMRFNTAISKLMEFCNALASRSDRPRRLLEPFVLLLAPFAPHLAEELWEVLGHSETLAHEPWPQYDDAICAPDQIEVALQINNKVRSKMTVPAHLSDDELMQLAGQDERIQSLVAGHTLVKTFVVSSRKGKLVNFVVQ